MSEDQDHEVGYGKPPKKNQFKKGQSGNPKGRPKGSKNIGVTLRNALNANVAVNAGGKATNMTVKEVIVTKMIRSAMEGSVSDQIRVLGAIDKYAPELMVDDTRPTEIEIIFVPPKKHG